MRNRLEVLNYLLWIIASLVIFAIITAAGWKIFYGYVLPFTQSLDRFSNLGLLAFAFVAGLGSFFAPCAIAIFPAYISYYLNLGDESNELATQKARIGKAVSLGFVASLGIFSFYLVIGVLLVAFGLTLASYVGYLKLVVILILFILGIILVSGRSISVRFLDRFRETVSQKATKGKSFFNIYLYGIVYGTAAATCFLPLFLALVLVPILDGKFFISVLTFLSYALAISFLLVLFTVLATLGRNVLVKKIASYAQSIKKVAGVVLILTSLYLIALYLLYGM